MNTSTLLLTPWMAPHKIIPWQTAVVMSYLGKVEVLEEYDEIVTSPSLVVKTPAVVRLKRAASGGSSRATSGTKRPVKFSRANVFARDGFSCQYCGVKKRPRELNYDHVVPRAQGGKTVWENIVTSCYDCNGKKRGRTPEQAGMKLLRQPVRPKTVSTSPVPMREGSVPTAWVPYWR